MTLLLTLVACTQTPGFGKPAPTDTGDTGDTHTGDTDPVETGDTDGDLDDDGFTPADGDCDDDNVHVSPARDEETDDGFDNDCDGRVDEEFSGFTVGRIDDDGAGSLIVLDTSGVHAVEIPLSDGCTAFFLDNLPGGGWVISDGASVSVVDTDGACTPLADFSETESATVYGVAVGPDGVIYATQPDTLVSIDPDGTVTTLATWSSEDDLYPIGLAADPKTGTLGLFDAAGGFATWNAEEGLVIQLAPGTEISTFSGTHKDGGGWYVPAASASGYGVFVYDEPTGAWLQEEAWTDEDWSPYMLAIDGDADEGHYYVTANANGIFPSVWKISRGSGVAADFYVIETDYAGYFWGIVTNYTYGE